MATFKEIKKADGSGSTLFYRTNFASTLDLGDLDIDTDSILYKTGLEISKMTEDEPHIVLCTEDYIYTDIYGTLMAVTRGTIYEMEHGTVVDEILVSGGGGGGGGTPRSNLSSAISPLEQNVSVKASVKLKFHFLTTALNKTGSAKLYVNNSMKSTMSVTSGEDYEFDVSKYLKLGTNYFTIRTADDNGAEKSFDFLVNAVQLILSSGFNGNIPIPNTFDYTYRIKGAGEKTVHFILDDNEITVVTTANDVDLTQKFSNLSHGSHSLVVYATADLEGETMTSNELAYTLLTYDPESSEVIMVSNFNTESCMEGEQLKIDYLVYDPANIVTNVSMYINNSLIMTTTADRTQHVWNVSSYPTGTVVFRIQCGSAYIEKTVEVEPVSVDIHEATEGLELKLTTANRSNQEIEPDRSTWKYNDIICEMNNFNWQSNGWIDGRLKLTGKANVVIPFQPFSTDLRKTGKTIEVEFITYDAFSITSKLISCIDEAGIGFDVKLDSSILSSEQESVSTQFGEGNKIRISFVIEPTSSNRLIKTYINGVLSGLRQYATDDNFQQAAPTNIIINPNEEEIDITNIRVYNRALNSKEIVNNWIYDMSDVSEKINAYNYNQIYDYYGNISYSKVKNYLPVVIVTGSMPTYKGDKKKVRVQYEHNTKTNYNFDQENCTIDVQGTSSQYYPRKNWKIKLVDKVSVDDGWIEEKTYCMKADFMESSHTYNIGTATLINDLYESEHYYPTRTVDNGVRDTMNGFPCVLFTKATEDADMVFAGTFMFNNDKADTDTLGYTTAESESWEFKNNTSDHCLFKSADFSAEAKPLDDFEARYPDEYEDFTALSRVFSWVVSCKNNPTKFKQEFDQYFDLHYCLIYQVMMELAIMVDSRAKNMFLDTADGLIWYPRFYDMDTCWGLNNEGVPAWSYDVEIHDQIGSAYVWDDRGASEFWNLFEEAYADEIKDMYHTLRAEKLTYDNILHYYIGNISSKFSASEYNEDSEFKYVGPLLDDANATYLYAAQGNRQDYFRWIVDKRLKYLDSKYEFGDYNSDFATMRWYTKDGDLTITTYQTMYIKVKFGSTDVKVRVEHDIPTTIKAPSGLEFNDTEVIIWGASQIIGFGDLTNKYPGTVDITKCAKLQSLKLCDETHTNTNLVSLSLGNNKLLRELEITNCPNLGGNLDISGCLDLRIFKAKGSKLSGFTLPTGSIIEKLYLPKTITTLSFKGLKNLIILDSESFNGVKTLIYEDTSYSLEDILAKCANLSRLRIIFDDNYSFSFDIDGIMYYHNNLIGVDEHGYNLPHPYLSGTLNIDIQTYHSETEINEYKSILERDYSNLRVLYNIVPSKFSTFTFYYPGTNIAEKYYKQIEDGIFIAQPNSGENAFKRYTSIVYSSKNLPDEIRKDVVFGALYIADNVSGLVFMPQEIRGIPIYAFICTYRNSIKGIESIIIPPTYRMFDLDFYEEYQFINTGHDFSLTLDSMHEDYYYNLGYMIPGSSRVAYGYGYDSTDATTGLRSVVFAGNVTINPLLCGPYLSTFVDTSKSKNFLYWLQFKRWLKDPDHCPVYPLDFSNYNFIIIGVNENNWFSYPRYVDLGDLSKKTFTRRRTNGGESDYTYDNTRVYQDWQSDTFIPNWKHMDKSITWAELFETNKLILENTSVTNLKSIGLSVTINEPSDFSQITNIDCSTLKLPYTDLDNPGFFPNATSLYTTMGSGIKNQLNLNVPSLTDIYLTRTYTGWSSIRVFYNLTTDRLIKVHFQNNRYFSTDSGNIGFGAYNARNPWMKWGLDCSELNSNLILRLFLDNQYYPHPENETDMFVTEFGGLINYGESFNASGHTLKIADYTSDTPEHEKQVILSIFTKLYDISAKGYTANIQLHTTLYNRLNLTAEERAIATAKGWTISSGSVA